MRSSIPQKRREGTASAGSENNCKLYFITVLFMHKKKPVSGNTGFFKKEYQG